MAPAWKVGWVQALGGSNPPFSAKYEWRLLYRGAIRICCNCADSGRRNGGTISTESPIHVILRGHDLTVFEDGVAL